MAVKTKVVSGLAAALLGSVGMIAAAQAEPLQLTIVHMNDLDDFDGSEDRGGFARIAAVIKAEEAKGGHVIVTHGGDTISPSLLSGFDQGRHMIDLYNKVGLDIMVPGNHEWDFGPEVAVERFSEAAFTIVSSNVTTAGGEQFPNTINTHMVELDGYKIGFYGITTTDTVELSTTRDTKFADEIETAQAKRDALREAGADFVVALAHVDVADDFAMINARVADLILAGHDHFLLNYYDGRTALVESSSQANYLTSIDLTMEKTESEGRVTFAWSPEFRPHTTVGVEPDAEVAALVKGYQDKLSAELDIDIGTTTTPIDSRRATVRGQEAAIGNLIADAIKAAVGADIAITNGGGIRADKEYAAGTVLTRRDILSELPFGNKTVKLELSGADVLAALENGFSQVENGAGRFPQVSGLTVEVDLKQPAGSRVTKVMVGGEPLDPQKTYTVATNDFMAGGGDGYTSFVGKPNLIDAAGAQLMATQVIDHVAAAKTISPAVEGRIVLNQ